MKIHTMCYTYSIQKNEEMLKISWLDEIAFSLQILMFGQFWGNVPGQGPFNTPSWGEKFLEKKKKKKPISFSTIIP